MSSSLPPQRPVALLDPWVAERIAAGEVVERPASIVKEAVENAIDAGATAIEVRLQAGGKERIEIWDNGHGMSAEDLVLAPQRHATSKIKSLEDLEKIQSLGFRGEALPSIAAVSELRIVSKTKESPTPFEWRNNAPRAEAVSFGDFLGSSHGTLLEASNLFSEIPARLKFLKSQAGEVSAVRDWLERLALSHPEVSFELRSDDRKIFGAKAESGPDAQAKRVSAILSDENDTPVLTRELVAGNYKLKAHWLRALSVPHTRKLIQVVNGRVLRDRLLQQAILQPFRQAFLPGQFPALLLSVELPPELMDVNVHPTKTEVRFLEPRVLFSAVQALFTEFLRDRSGIAAPATDEPASWNPQTDSSQNPAPLFFNENAPRSFGGSNFTPPSSPSLFTDPGLSLNQPMTTTGSLFGENPLEAEPLGNYLGQLFETYLLFQQDRELVLVDQHAADERIRYERLQRSLQKRENESQMLLVPEPVRVPDLSDSAQLSQLVPVLDKLGFGSEVFGEDTLLFRSVPAFWGNQNLKTRLHGLVLRGLEALEESPHLAEQMEFDHSLFEKIAMEACHSSIRSGDRVRPEEAKVLVRALLDCKHPWNCPHGRPTLVRVPESRFEDWFLRNVPSKGSAWKDH